MTIFWCCTVHYTLAFLSLAELESKFFPAFGLFFAWKNIDFTITYLQERPMDHITHLTLVLSNKQYSDITNACHSKPNIMFNFGLLASSLSLDIRYSFMVVIPNVKHVRYPVCNLVSVVGSFRIYLDHIKESSS